MLFLLILGIFANAEGTLNVIPSTEKIVDQKEHFKITCNFEHDDPNMASFDSLTMFHKAEDEDDFRILLSVNSNQPIHVVQAKNFTGGSDGHARENGPVSYLQADYFKPTEKQGGTYQCEAVGVDKYSHKIEVTNYTTVEVDIAPEEEGEDPVLLKQIKTLEQDLERAENILQRCQNAPVVWLEAVKNQAQKSSSWTENVYGVSELFQSESFYIFIDEKAEFYRITDICDEYSGFLVEINTEAEFSFIEKSLNDLSSVNPPSFSGLLTGAYSPDPDTGYEFFTHAYDNVYADRFETGQPDKVDEDSDWLNLKYDSGKLVMTNDKRDNDKYGGVCEVDKEFL